MVYLAYDADLPKQNTKVKKILVRISHYALFALNVAKSIYSFSHNLNGRNILKMPNAERRLVKQNIERLQAYVKKTNEYLIAIGMPFIEQGEKTFKETGEWPEGYQQIAQGVDLALELNNSIGVILETLLKLVDGEPIELIDAPPQESE